LSDRVELEAQVIIWSALTFLERELVDSDTEREGNRLSALIEGSAAPFSWRWS
jgi:hypothetical protein